MHNTEEQLFYEELKKASIEEIDEAFINACKNGNLNKVKYISTSKNLNRSSKFNWINKLLNKDVNDLNRNFEGFISACEKGQVEIVKYLMNPNNITNLDFPLGWHLSVLRRGFDLACEAGHLEVIKHLFTYPNLATQISKESGFMHACINGHMETIKYIATSQELNDIDLNFGLKGACSKGNLEVIKYLLTSTDLKKHANINSEKYEGISYLCAGGYLDVLKYLVESPELKQNIDINVILANNPGIDLGFRDAYQSNHWDVINYLIFEKNIQKNDEIEFYLSTRSDKEVERIKNMFKIRERNKELENELSLNSDNQKSKKMKL